MTNSRPSALLKVAAAGELLEAAELFQRHAAFADPARERLAPDRRAELVILVFDLLRGMLVGPLPFRHVALAFVNRAVLHHDLEPRRSLLRKVLVELVHFDHVHPL